MGELVEPIVHAYFRYFARRLLPRFFTARHFASGRPACGSQLGVVVAFRGPHVHRRFVVFPARGVTVVPHRVVAVSVLVETVLLSGGRHTARLWWNVGLKGQWFEIVRVLPFGRGTLLLSMYLVLTKVFFRA